MIALSGRGGGAGLRGRVRAGLAEPASMRLEGLAPFGAPVFYLVASPADATLWLTREARVVTGVPAPDLFASLTGIPFGPDDLRAVLTGCLVPDPRPVGGRRHGDWVAVDLAGGAVAWLREIEGGHHLVAGTRDGLTIEYGEFRRGLPRLVRVVSDAERRRGRAPHRSDGPPVTGQPERGPRSGGVLPRRACGRRAGDPGGVARGGTAGGPGRADMSVPPGPGLLPAGDRAGARQDQPGPAGRRPAPRRLPRPADDPAVHRAARHADVAGGQGRLPHPLLRPRRAVGRGQPGAPRRPASLDRAGGTTAMCGAWR